MHDYSFWKQALKDPSKIGREDLPVHDSHPQPGFYRMRDKDGGDMIPVAIWEKPGHDLVAKVGARMLHTPEDIWSFCCRFPVSEEDYRAAAAGNGWKDSAPENPVAQAGHNMPEDPFEALMLELEGEEEIAKELIKKEPTTEDEADKVANFAKRMATINTKFDEMFTIEKRPWLDGGKAVDNKFREPRDRAKDWTSKLKRHLDKYLAAEREKERERQRIAAEDAARIRREAEAAAKAAEDVSPNPDDPEMEAKRQQAEELAAQAARAEKEAQARAVTAGRTGSKISMRTVKSAQIVDYDKLVEALKDREEMKELVQSLANRAAKSGFELDGMKIITEQRAV